MNNGTARAAVRLADGKLCLVTGVPSDVQVGQYLLCRMAGKEFRGPVAVPPSLVAWCDPDLEAAMFVAAEDVVAAAREEPCSVLAQVSAAVDAPTVAEALAMVGRAWREISALENG